MRWIDETWLHDALAALKATCDVDAHTRNEMIQFLLDNGFWDQEKLKDWASAVAKFNSCLNPNKAEFFKIGELWALMRRFGRHQLFLAMAADLGYEVRPIPTEHRRQALMQQLLDAQAQCAAASERVASQLERLSTAAPVVGVPSVLRGALGPCQLGSARLIAHQAELDVDELVLLLDQVYRDSVLAVRPEVRQVQRHLHSAPRGVDDLVRPGGRRVPDSPVGLREALSDVRVLGHVVEQEFARLRRPE